MASLNSPSTRDRSDTLDSDASGSTSFLLQTPPTPSILDIFVPLSHGRAGRTTKNDSASPSHRRDTVESGTGLESAVDGCSPSRDRGMSIASASSGMFVLDPDDAQSHPSSRLPLTGTSTPTNRLDIDGYPFPAMSGQASPPSTQTVPGFLSPSGEVPGNPVAGSPVAEKGIKNTMRVKLERSRSSLRSLSAKLKNGDDGTERSLPPTGSGGPASLKRPGAKKLRSLFSLSGSTSRSLSDSAASTPAASLPSGYVTPSQITTPILPSPSQPISADSSLAADFVPSQSGDLMPSPEVVETSLPPEHAPLGPVRETASTTAPPKRPRAVSEPLLSPGILSISNQQSAEDQAERSRKAARRAHQRDPDLFGTMLPREIQVMILRQVAEACTSRGGEAAMTAFRGRRELIKLTRISKQWHSLCLDGQLWSTIDFAPIAPFLHKHTLEIILTNTARCISSLSLRGADDVAPWAVLSSLRPQHGIQLPSLLHLDLRGMRRFTESDLYHLFRITPNLRIINLSGFKRLNADNLRALGSIKSLNKVDLSRTGINATQMREFFREMKADHSMNMRVFKCAGAQLVDNRSRKIVVDLARMTNLEVLDIGDSDLNDELVDLWVRKALESRYGQGVSATSPQRVLSLRHLRLSGCHGLTANSLKALTGRLPYLESLELANMPRFFRRPNRDRQELVRDRMIVASFFASLKSLRKIDLDDFGTRDGGLTNEMMEALESEIIEEVNAAESGAGVDVECMVGFVRRCKALRVFNVDNTNADDRVLAEWVKHRHTSYSTISMLDCSDVTAAKYAEVAKASWTRRGRRGYEYAPFMYGPGEIADEPADLESEDAAGESASDMMRRCSSVEGPEVVLADDSRGKGVIKTAWAWKRIGVARPWREEREKARRAGQGDLDADVTGASARTQVRPGRGRRRRGSWWTSGSGSSGYDGTRRQEEEGDFGGACVVM